MFFLNTLLLASQAVLSMSAPIAPREAADWYLVYPTEPSNGPQVQETEQYLKSLLKTGSVVREGLTEGPGVQYWKVLTTPTIVNIIEANPQVRLVALNTPTPALHRRSDPKRYIVWANNRYDEDEMIETRKFLESKVTHEGQHINSFRAGWGALALDDAALEEEKKDDIDSLTHFVRESHEGKDTFIYVVEWGVAGEVTNKNKKCEFPAGQIDYLQTALSKDNKQWDNTDEHFYSHGTAVASIAAGQLYGVAKKAHLISVKSAVTASDSHEAFEEIQHDWILTPGREKKSVIISSMSEPKIYMEAEGKTDFEDAWMETLHECHEKGVPVVFASGSLQMEDPDREEVDLLPMSMESKTIPVINVGSAKKDGSRDPLSQGGPKLTVHAPGDAVEVQTKVNEAKFEYYGSSMAAPAVAGLIALYMAYDKPPWVEGDTPEPEGYARVQAIKDYIMSDKSSYERSPGIKMIWNGATEQNHKDAVEDPPVQPDSPEACADPTSKHKRSTCNSTVPITCHGLPSDKLSKVIAEEFCPQLGNMTISNSTSSKYLQDTADMVTITITALGNSTSPSETECTKNMGTLVSGCDKVSDMKAGGEANFFGWKYSIVPEVQRLNSSNARI
ncbi:peptidase S8/S53 domain-containing protein [Massariosphaeria phaeospora]|uniref:Peptidase S8/S53 domain-containing protein n=1 Tax=Massariosphaeria phaeospora TaxID=100035 RepID=A0A7C8M4Q7_9PLEO|nr:peptidase S8/S53 domain-containing protein [Massariosphaeria phaeospora]